MSNQETVSDMVSKASLPVTVTGLNLFGITLPEIVQLLTGVYVFLMAVDKLYILVIRYRESRLKELREIKGEDGHKE